MGLLAPLYALAALAIAGPILLHLIRRQPQGEQQFSSLMFLKPSPPTLTRRSRVENWLLLLLRVAAIALIAFAFARPYLREESLLNLNLDGRNVVLVVDTSASMKRPGVWESAQAEVQDVLNSLGPSDRVSLYQLDQGIKSVVSYDPGATVDSSALQQAVRIAIDELSPTWHGSELGVNLAAVSDQLAAEESSETAARAELVLISDLHAGSGVEGLQGYPWPKDIQLTVRQVSPTQPGNAFLSLMDAKDTDGDLPEREKGQRVRLENSAESEVQNLQLGWSDDDGNLTQTTTVQVPAGQVRVIPVPQQPSDSDRLRLSGDAWEDDNELFVFKPEPQLETVAYVAADSEQEAEPKPDPTQEAAYFLGLAPLDTDLVKRKVASLRSEKLTEAFADPTCRSIVLEPSQTAVQSVDRLQAFVRAGGTLLVCMSESDLDERVAGDLLGALLQPVEAGDSSGTQASEPAEVIVEQATEEDYRLVGWVDYQDPLFAPFADPRFNDFTKIRFWRHYRVSYPTQWSQVRTVARFDNQSPMLLHRRLEGGHIWVLTTGWQPEASGLALSTKFVPILNGLLDPAGLARRTQEQYEVGERIPCEAGSMPFRKGGVAVPENEYSAGEDWLCFERPGLFFVRESSTSETLPETESGATGKAEPFVGGDDVFAHWFSVAMPASERDVTPLDIDVFEQYGISLGQFTSETQREESARQLQIEELEQRQKLWQWLLAAGIGVLLLETILSSLAARKKASQLATT